MRPEPEPAILTLIGGCMFSGKTTLLLRRLERYRSSAVAAFKHEIDRRYSDDRIISHGGKARSAVTIGAAADMLDHIRDGIEVVALDEAHFFKQDLPDVVDEFVRRGTDVVITSLDRDSWGRPFALAQRLAAMADEPVSLRATCARCGARADRTQRLTPIIDGQMVGGPESYEPRCRSCWHPPPETPPDDPTKVP